jgi:hypothetical protein
MDPHENEYAAAVAAMPEHTISPSLADRFPIGSGVTYRLYGWSQSSYDDGQVIGHHDGKVLLETVDDVVEVDPRPWPLGNVLPF